MRLHPQNQQRVAPRGSSAGSESPALGSLTSPCTVSGLSHRLAAPRELRVDAESRLTRFLCW